MGPPHLSPQRLRAPHFEYSTGPQRRGHHRVQTVIYGHNLAMVVPPDYPVVRGVAWELRHNCGTTPHPPPWYRCGRDLTVYAPERAGPVEKAPQGERVNGHVENGRFRLRSVRHPSLQLLEEFFTFFAVTRERSSRRRISNTALAVNPVLTTSPWSSLLPALIPRKGRSFSARSKKRGDRIFRAVPVPPEG